MTDVAGNCSAPIVIPTGSLHHPLLESLFCLKEDKSPYCLLADAPETPQVAISFEELSSRVPTLTCDQYLTISGEVYGLLEVVQVDPHAADIRRWDQIGEVWERTVANQQLILRKAKAAAAKKGYALKFRPYNREGFVAIMMTPQGGQTPERVGVFRRDEIGMLALLDTLREKINNFPAHQIEGEYQQQLAEVKRQTIPSTRAEGPGVLSTSGGGSFGYSSLGAAKTETRLPAALDLTEGPPTREKLNMVLRRMKPAMQTCYERVLKKNPWIKGGIVVQFRISSRGRAIAPRVINNTLGRGMTFFEKCILDVVRRTPFPPSDGNTIYDAPYLFSPAGG